MLINVRRVISFTTHVHSVLTQLRDVQCDDSWFILL